MLKRTSRILLEATAAALTAALIIVAIAGVRLSQGPVGLPFLKPYFEDAMTAPDGQYATAIGVVDLAWGGWRRNFDIRLLNVEVRDQAGTIIAAAPTVSAELSVLALLRGTIAPVALELVGGQLRVVRDADGLLRVGPRQNTGEAGNFGWLASIFSAENNADTGPIKFLRTFRIAGGAVEISDLASGYTWVARDADISITRVAAGIEAQAHVAVPADGHRAVIDVDGFYRSESRDLRFRVGFDDLNLGAMAATTFGPPILQAVNIPLTGHVHGQISLATMIGGLSFEIAGRGGRVQSDDTFPDGIPIRTLALRGSVDAATKTLQVGDGAIDFDGTIASVSGSATLGESGVEGAIQITAKGLPVGQLPTLWPRLKKDGGRQWVANHITEGTIVDATALVQLGPGEAGAAMSVTDVTASFRYEGLSVSYLPAMPPVVAVRGTGKLSLDGLEFEIEGGKMDALDIFGGDVAVTGFGEFHQDLSIRADVSGAVPVLLRILGNPPVSIGRWIAIDPDETDGMFRGEVSLAFPLIRDLPFDLVALDAELQTTGFSLPRAVVGNDLTEGALVFTVDNHRVGYAGHAVIASTPVTVTGRENFDASNAGRRRNTLEGRLGSAARKALGLDLDPYLTGPVDTVLTATEDADGVTDLVVAATLDDARLQVPAVGWVKEEGTAAKLTLDARLPKAGGVVLRNIALSGAGIEVRGRMDMAPGKKLTRLNLSPLRFRDNDADLTISESGPGLAIEIGGKSFDASELIDPKEEDDVDLPPLSIVAEIDRVRVGSGPTLRDLRGTLAYDGKSWREIVLGAETERQGRVSFTIREKDSGDQAGPRIMSLRSDDGGSVLASLGVMDNLRGGNLEITGDMTERGGFKGKLLMTEFRATGMPVLAQILRLASLYGVVDLLSGEGVGFTRLDSDLDMAKGVLQLGPAKAFGADLGITFEGPVDFNTGNLDLRGTIVPAYAVNSVLGKIPIVGGVLAGEGGGLIGANYRVRGPRANPDVSVNPLSALAPGFLRNLFDILESAPDTSVPENGGPTGRAGQNPAPSPEAVPPEKASSGQP